MRQPEVWGQASVVIFCTIAGILLLGPFFMGTVSPPQIPLLSLYPLSPWMDIRMHVDVLMIGLRRHWKLAGVLVMLQARIIVLKASLPETPVTLALSTALQRQGPVE
ncbi:hypothetical protein Ahy_A04g021006 [Arachis hypogaea]|uniref:Uncharacterized protein n=1 Tax=Arachis hypogaea TaxID=3818 RepID=A0A445DJ56_ARAHY|nr:hypothetical protein Ahy_A04g021006 [Arachis hypogaea]